MTTGYIAPGKLMKFTAPSGGVQAGVAYQIGGLLVIAAEAVAQTLPFDGAVEGVFELPKPDQEAWSEGAKIYFDSGASPHVFTDVIGSPALDLVGSCAKAVPVSLALSSDAGGNLVLDADAGTIQVAAYAALSGAVLTVTVNGVATVLTEGVNFDAETSDEVTATNIGAALQAIPGITNLVATDTVTITVTHPSITGHVRLDGAVR